MKRFLRRRGRQSCSCVPVSAASAQRDSVERGTRMDTDALRDDVRTNRLEIPRHPLAARAACSTFSRFKRKSQVQEKRRKQQLAAASRSSPTEWVLMGR